MSMETQAAERAPLDTAELLSGLARFWERPRAAQRIAGSLHDQEVPAGTQNPYWEVIRQLPLDDILSPWHSRPEPSLYWHGMARGDVTTFADRFAICGTYSWSICSPGDIAWMKGILNGRGVVEPGAGGGYWAWQMEQAGIDTVAYDPQVPGEHKFSRKAWTTVLRDDHSVTRHHPDRALFLCWPSYAEPWAAQALANYKGELLIYAGEGYGGCCADDDFFGLLDAEWSEASESGRHVSYWGINCYLTAYKRK